MHCACTKRPYFHFRSKIWRHHRVPLPRFPLRRENFGDSHIFKADTGLLNICMGFQDLLAKMGVLWGKIGEWVVRYWPPNELVLPFLGFLRLCQFWWKLIKKCNCESARRRTDTLTDWQTDANQFYNLSHAICYSYGTGKEFCSQDWQKMAKYHKNARGNSLSVILSTARRAITILQYR